MFSWASLSFLSDPKESSFAVPETEIGLERGGVKLAALNKGRLA